MDRILHGMSDLFAQLGLPSEPEAIRAFIEAHRAEAAHRPLPEAPFWTPAQAAFLQDELQGDADWSGVIDALDRELHPKDG